MKEEELRRKFEREELTKSIEMKKRKIDRECVEDDLDRPGFESRQNFYFATNFDLHRVVVVARVVEWSLSICSSNPVIGKFYLLSTVLKRRKYKKKRSEMVHLKNLCYAEIKM